MHNYILASPIDDVLSQCTSEPAPGLSACRFVVYNPNKTLQGYWYLRKTDTDYTMTVKDPISRRHFMRTAQTPAKLLSDFYASYVKYLNQIFEYLERELKLLPTIETPRPGFRPGWLQLKRNVLINRRDLLKSRSQDALVNILTMTRVRGWPHISLPALPWESVHVARAASTPWLRTDHGGQVPSQSVHPYDRGPIRSVSGVRP